MGLLPPLPTRPCLRWHASGEGGEEGRRHRPVGEEDRRRGPAGEEGRRRKPVGEDTGGASKRGRWVGGAQEEDVVIGHSLSTCDQCAVPDLGFAMLGTCGLGASEIKLASSILLRRAAVAVGTRAETPASSAALRSNR
ncbi:hypothetical protein PR202_ga20065 [Eleusine coracana subsp. coracana]|uniref:Uncharacterized protein n=1 Tax=Eleusine coracana subsp. coracana TaxID=191504 RepID=A0AAV5CW44_ELECO|nr:hypothetical protein PR202_ga20065 [Eleusine coracana subsp. coracana]